MHRAVTFYSTFEYSFECGGKSSYSSSNDLLDMQAAAKILYLPSLAAVPGACIAPRNVHRTRKGREQPRSGASLLSVPILTAGVVSRRAPPRPARAVQRLVYFV